MNITLKVPASLVENEIEPRQFIAANLYEAGRFSLLQAAEMTGFEKRTFAALLCSFGVSLMNYPVSEMIDDTNRIKSILP